MRDNGSVRNIIVGTRDTSSLHGAREHGRAVEADDSDVIVHDGVNVLRVHDDPADSVHAAARAALWL